MQPWNILYTLVGDPYSTSQSHANDFKLFLSYNHHNSI